MTIVSIIFLLLCGIILYHIQTRIRREGLTGFCEHHSGSTANLNESCSKLTQTNCGKTSCCVWTNKCVAGSEKGPTYNTNEKGKTNHLDYYYFQNKCHGPKCL